MSPNPRYSVASDIWIRLRGFRLGRQFHLEGAEAGGRGPYVLTILVIVGITFAVVVYLTR